MHGGRIGHPHRAIGDPADDLGLPFDQVQLVSLLHLLALAHFQRHRQLTLDVEDGLLTLRAVDQHARLARDLLAEKCPQVTVDVPIAPEVPVSYTHLTLPTS